MAEPDKVTEPEARVAYLALGPGRKLATLADHFGPRSVTVRCYELWSAANDWQALAADHDERATARAVAKVETSQANERAEVAKLARKAARALINRLLELAG